MANASRSNLPPMSMSADDRSVEPLRLLVVAYACEPGRGSEPGAGWALVEAALELAECTVLVGSEHVHALETWRRSNRGAPLEIIEVENPRGMTWLRATRLGWFLLYLGWCRKARRVAEALAESRRFDAAWHATYSVYWLPSPIRTVRLPAIWGPVGGAVVSPLSLWRGLGISGVVGELVDLVAVRVGSLLPATRRTWARVDSVLAQNPQTVQRLPLDVRARATIVNHAEFLRVSPVGSQRRDGDISKLLWIGAMEARKRPDLALEGLARAGQDVRMTMVGDGPLADRVRRMVTDLGLDDRVALPGRIPRAEVLQRLSSARGAVFTGSREEGGLALAEALAYGTPCVVLAHGGAGTIAARPDDPRIRLVEPRRREATIAAIGSAMTDIYRSREPRSSGMLMRSHAIARLHEAIRAAIDRRGQAP